jgi:ABC-type amino acid transport substrate-binding protein
MNPGICTAVGRMLRRYAGLVLLGASTALSAAAPIRFVEDQTAGMPVTRIEVHDGDVQIAGGLITELETAIARELGHPATFLATPRKRVEQSLETGRGDVLCYYDPVWLEHPDHFGWTGPIIANSNLLVARQGVELPDRVGNLQQGRIGMVSGYVYPELQDLAQRPGIQRDDAPDDESNFRKLIAGRTDFLLTHQLFLDYMLALQPELASKLGGRLVVRSFETRCAVGKASPVTAGQIDAAIAALKRRGEYDAILGHYR